MPALLEQLHSNGVRPLRQVRPVPDVWLDRQRNRTEKETPVSGDMNIRRVQRSRKRGWRMPRGAVYVPAAARWSPDEVG